jgi:flagellar protein FlaG
VRIAARRADLPGRIHISAVARAGATLGSMNPPPAPKIQLINTSDYRENYANSVQIRVNLWDFFLMFGLVNQTSPENVSIQNFQGIYVSPQQAKALLNVLQQNVQQYESAFGEIKLEPQASGGIVQ